MKFNISVPDLEIQLKRRRAIPYNWRGKKQNNGDDKKSNFIYSSPYFDYIQNKIAEYNLENLSDYIWNRWYNFWSAKAVESIFVENKNIIAERDAKNKYSDFSVYDEISKKKFQFDHKTTVIPKYFESKILKYIKDNTDNTDNFIDLHQFDAAIVQWLYENQSQEQRKHWNNRFFVILVDTTKKEHWKIKSELSFLHSHISKYLSSFTIEDCVQFKHGENKVFAGVFWVVR
ncbi:TPA: hypothetical protein EYG96_00565 [Candidatus Gracilibacteria bacterium]|nr:hypothetical protein [Candidatus Peregrinibacteria bacterium]HIQ56520.1 hypothetical protein [Candidatus Gracilibacteria bacterium]HIQ57349.1 hypothetical protein [Candidatus Gracilibacteria bacterium]